MNIANLHTSEKKVSAIKLENQGESVITSIRILKDETLAKHVSITAALLICMSGEIIYETEKEEQHTLKAGDFVNIEPNILHWMRAAQESQLLLIK